VADELERNTTRPLPGPTNKDLDRAMWYFWSKVYPRVAPPMVEQDQPPVPEPRDDPKGDPPPSKLTLPVRYPQWQQGNYWAVPFVLEQEVCGLWYKTWQTIAATTVPDTRMVVITDLSYEVEGSNFEVFEVESLRSGIRIGHVEDMVIDAANPNPAEQNVFGGHYLPVPTYLRFDQSDRIVFRVKVNGPETPIGVFPRTEDDYFSGNVKVIAQGWMATMLERRDSVPRPVDPGYQLDNYGQPLVDPMSYDAAKALIDYLSEVEPA
jgi:hypothetical protein